MLRYYFDFLVASLVIELSTVINNELATKGESRLHAASEHILLKNFKNL